MVTQPVIAYFSMEMTLAPEMPIYSGGLGVLAGDTMRTAADLRLPMVGVTLLHRKGYFYQKLQQDGWQVEESAAWPVEEFVKELPQRVSIVLDRRTVHLRAWQYDVRAIQGCGVPVYLLDAALPENAEQDRALTDTLYGGDAYYRLCQEAVLGIGGVKMLRALGYQAIDCFHMNEGHASLLTLALLEEQAQRDGRQHVTADDIAPVKQRCVFTTHTPVAAGHDRFPLELAMRVLAYPGLQELPHLFCVNRELHLTHVALNWSRYANAVSRRHGEVARRMFPGHAIDYITNGVHAVTWTSPPFQTLFDEYTPGWREDSTQLRAAVHVPSLELRHAHARAKWHLIDYVNRETNARMEVDRFTIGFARRSTAYKRATLLLTDPERLMRMASRVGPIQIVYAGKAHPHDPEGKEFIRQIVDMHRQLRDPVKMVYLANHDMTLGQLMTAGVDVWLNTPQPPLEASGTSGMKAALNGVPSVSVLDGWWVEGHREGVTGWSIGAAEQTAHDTPGRGARDAALLYDKLEQVILPLFYHERERFIDVMRQTIAINGTAFNTQRMLKQYMERAYASP